MRITSVIVAIGVSFTLVNAAAGTSPQGMAAIVARSDPASVHIKRNALKEGSNGNGNGIKRKMKRGTGQCKPKAPVVPRPAGSTVPIPQQHNVDPSPPKQDPKPEPPKEQPKPEPPKEQPKPQPQPEQPKPQPQPQPQPQQPPQDNNGGGGDADSRLGWINGFQGTNTNAILSWFRTKDPKDSTNGMSWCQTRYQDDWDCFAPSVGTMLKNFNYDYVKAAKAYCGREAEITYNGKTTKAFICDGFDDRWVRTPSSLDLTVGLFAKIYGSFTGDKMKVGMNASWRLTGNVVEKGTFQKNKYA